MATLKMMGITELTGLDILAPTAEKPRGYESHTERTKRDLEVAIHRLQRNKDKTQNR